MESWLELGRDKQLRQSAATTSRSTAIQGAEAPHTLLCPTRWLPWERETDYPEVNDFIESFTSDLESFYRLKRDPVDLDEIFQSQNPGGTGQDIPSYLFYVCLHR
jgi:hypothetical protein